MKCIFCFLGLLWLFFEVNAQENIKRKGNAAAVEAVDGYKALKPGDQVPDLLLGKVLNSGNSGPVRLSDFSGRLLILDFWAPSCGACIEAMPRLDSLQRIFSGRMVVLPVTAEKAGRVVSFQKNSSFLKGWKFRTVVEDELFGILFPHRLLPHEVWIDGNGVVLGVTEGGEVTADNISGVLAGKGLGLANKQDAMDFDRDKPLLVDGNGGADAIYRYRSVMTGKLPGLPAGVSIGYDSAKRLTVVRATNVTLRRLYAIVFKGLRILPDSVVDLVAANGLTAGKDGENSMFCYELDIPETSPGLVRRAVREDLDRFFGVRSAWTGNAFRLIRQSRELMDNEPLTL